MNSRDRNLADQLQDLTPKQIVDAVDEARGGAHKIHPDLYRQAAATLLLVASEWRENPKCVEHFHAKILEHAKMISEDLSESLNHSESVLTIEQQCAALHLLVRRPPVFPGTRAIADTQHKELWHKKVEDTMRRLGIKTDTEIKEFYDMAGVAD